jgi:hypothetical protein
MCVEELSRELHDQVEGGGLGVGGVLGNGVRVSRHGQKLSLRSRELTSAAKEIVHMHWFEQMSETAHMHIVAHMLQGVQKRLRQTLCQRIHCRPACCKALSSGQGEHS